jgi:hypothetical protein
MLGLTVCGLNTPLNRFVFSRNSTEYMMRIVSGSAVMQGLLLLGVWTLPGCPTPQPWLGRASGASNSVLGPKWAKGGGDALARGAGVHWVVPHANRPVCAVCSNGRLQNDYAAHNATSLSFWRVRLTNAHGQHIFLSASYLGAYTSHATQTLWSHLRLKPALTMARG